MLATQLSVFVPTRIPTALMTKTTVTEEAVMPISPARKRGGTITPSATPTSSTTTTTTKTTSTVAAVALPLRL
jgi:hypothetical protein